MQTIGQWIKSSVLFLAGIGLIVWGYQANASARDERKATDDGAGTPQPADTDEATDEAAAEGNVGEQQPVEGVSSATKQNGAAARQPAQGTAQPAPATGVKAKSQTAGTPAPKAQPKTEGTTSATKPAAQPAHADKPAQTPAQKHEQVKAKQTTVESEAQPEESSGTK